MSAKGIANERYRNRPHRHADHDIQHAPRRWKPKQWSQLRRAISQSKRPNSLWRRPQTPLADGRKPRAHASNQHHGIQMTWDSVAESQPRAAAPERRWISGAGGGERARSPSRAERARAIEQQRTPRLQDAAAESAGSRTSEPMPPRPKRSASASHNVQMAAVAKHDAALESPPEHERVLRADGDDQARADAEALRIAGGWGSIGSKTVTYLDSISSQCLVVRPRLCASTPSQVKEAIGKNLIVVVVVLAFRVMRDRAEQPIRLIVNAGREKQRGRRSGIGVVAKTNPP